MPQKNINSSIELKMSFAAPLIDRAIVKHTATVIICHGLGDSGAGWTWLASSFRSQKKFEGVKFIFPNAPVIFCLSGFLLLSENIEDFMPKNSPNQIGKTPIFLGHGDSDPIVKPELAQLTYDTLSKLGWNADLNIYKYVVIAKDLEEFSKANAIHRGLGHTSSKQELLDLETYLDKVIPAVDSSITFSH